MPYTAIIKDGGLFIPNVFSDVDDGQLHVVQVQIDIEDVREQLSSNHQLPKAVPRKSKKEVLKKYKEVSLRSQQNSIVTASDELQAMDDKELSEIFKAYVNEGQISLENL